MNVKLSMMSHKDYVKMIAERTGMSAYSVDKIMREASSILGEELSAGNSVRVRGVGTFDVIEQPARKLFVPSTGEQRGLPARLAPRFKAAADLKRLITGEDD